ncbi:UNVERIFIED_CONTAM: hypothetical protein GTU68_017465 [Idotea baltica]|nr:hypothetical protein [Idotea baltica]
MILLLDEVKVSKSMKQVLKKNVFRFSFDTHFEYVIDACAGPRDYEEGTWINSDMRNAYVKLHKLGYAHSIEVWQENEIVGGLYGVCLGKAFFGESMFAHASNASKAALIYLCRFLQEREYHFVDCQMETEHLKSMGAKTIAKESFLKMLNISNEFESLKGSWKKFILAGSLI